MLCRDVRLGEVEDLLLDAAHRRLLGFVVLCGDGVRRTVPLAAAEVEGTTIQVGSPLVLMEDAFYRERCRLFTSLVDAAIRRGPVAVGTLRDILFDADGRVRALDVDGLGQLSAGSELSIDVEPSTSAA